MNKLSILQPPACAEVDHDALIALYSQLGEIEADQVICRAIEEIAVRLSQIERLYRQAQYEPMAKCIRSLRSIGDQIGMAPLSSIASDVANCISSGDEVALAATLGRMIRTGEKSLLEIWDIQGISG